MEKNIRSYTATADITSFYSLPSCFLFSLLVYETYRLLPASTRPLHYTQTAGHKREVKIVVFYFFAFLWTETMLSSIK